jgi:hypothetical protein
LPLRGGRDRRSAGRGSRGRGKKLRDCLTDRLTVGQHADKIVAAARERGHPLPPGIADGPELREDLEPAWRAFHLLSAARPVGGMGVAMPIPFGEIDAYARRYGIAGDAFDAFLEQVGTLDAVWLEHHAKRS